MAAGAWPNRTARGWARLSVRGVAKRSVGVAGWGCGLWGRGRSDPAPAPAGSRPWAPPGGFLPPRRGQQLLPGRAAPRQGRTLGYGGLGGLGWGLGVPVGLGGAGAVAGGRGSSWVCEGGGPQGAEGVWRGCVAVQGKGLKCLWVCGGGAGITGPRRVWGGVSVGQGGSRASPWGRGSHLGGVGDVRSPQRRRRRRC